MSLLNDLALLCEIGGTYDFYKTVPEADKVWVVLVKNVDTGEPRFLLVTDQGKPTQQFGMNVAGSPKKPDLYFSYKREQAEQVADFVERKGVTSRDQAKAIALPLERFDFIRKRVSTRWKSQLQKARRAKLAADQNPTNQQLQAEALLESITIPWTGPSHFPDELVNDFLEANDIFAPGIPFEHRNTIAAQLTKYMDDKDGCTEWRGYRFNKHVFNLVDQIRDMVSNSRKSCASDMNRVKYQYPDLGGRQQY